MKESSSANFLGGAPCLNLETLGPWWTICNLLRVLLNISMGTDSKGELNRRALGTFRCDTVGILEKQRVWDQADKLKGLSVQQEAWA